MPTLYKSVLQFDDVKFHQYEFDQIIIDVGSEVDIDATYTPRIVNFGRFVIGNDSSDDELLFLPGRFDIEIRFDSIIDYRYVVAKLQAKTDENITIKVYDTPGNLFFKGQVDSKTISMSDYLRVIGLTFLDDYKQLNEPNDYTVQTSVWKIYNLITKMMGSDYTYPGDLDVDFSALRFKSSLDNAKYLDNFGFYDSFIFTIPLFPTRGDALRAVLDNTCSMMVVGFNGKIQISPRYYIGGRIWKIYRRNTEKDTLECSFTKTYRGMVVYSYINDYEHLDKDDTSYGTVEYDDGGIEYLYPNDIMELHIIAGVGSVDDNPQSPGYSRVGYVYDGGWGGAKTNGCAMKYLDGTYGLESSLKQLVCDRRWIQLGTKRKKYKLTTWGVDYKLTDYFQLENNVYLFRPIKFEFDYPLNKTIITVVEDLSAPWDDYMMGSLTEQIIIEP